VAEAKAVLDILPNREGPPLSAVSDMPVAKAAPVAVAEPAAPEVTTEAESVLRADPPKQIEAKEPDAPETEAKAEEPEPKAAKEDTTDPAIKREITKARNKQREAEARAAAAEEKADSFAGELAKLNESIAKLTNKPVEEVQDPRPTRDKFETPDAYDEALIEWSGRQAGEKARLEAQKEHLEAVERDNAERIQKEQKATADAVLADWAANREKAAEKYADYAEVAEADDVPISAPVAFALMGLGDRGPELAYHLGKNIDEAKRIAALVMPDGTPNAPLQVFELGRLAELAFAPAKVSKAPEPITPLGSRERAAGTPPSEQSMEEYANSAAVQARLKADRRPGGYAN